MVALFIGGRVTKQSDPHEWFLFAHDELVLARLPLTDVELPGPPQGAVFIGARRRLASVARFGH